ncbi:LCP family protein [Nocardioidaceae bacterium]|nr:LCP family protein [Nocardioidaceae bacterium]
MGESGRGGRGGSGDSGESADDFGWLYGSKGRSSDGSREARGPRRPSQDADPTQVMRIPRDPDDEQTQVIRRPGAAETTGARGGGAAAGRGGDDRRFSGPPPDRPAPAVAPPPRPRRRRGTGRRIRRALLLLVVAWLVYLLAVPLYAFSQVPRVEFEPAGDRPASQPGTTYLVVGNDGRGDLTQRQRRRLSLGPEDVGQRTDTILLLHVGSGPNLLLSIPRDSLVDVPDQGVTKINAAYAFGGAPLLAQTIEQNTGIRVDEYVEIGLLGLVQLVNAVDGITVCPEEPIVDPLANLKIRRGCSEVNGLRALGYARSRKTSTLGDIDRAARQREVVSAIGSKITSPRTVLDPFRYWAIGQAGSKSIAVGEGTGALALGRFAFAMTRVNGENGLTCSVPIVDLAVNWDPERAPRMFRLIAEDRTEDIGRQLCTGSGLPGTR